MTNETVEVERTFREINTEANKRMKMGRFTPSGHKPFVNAPIEGELKGKRAIRWAKRQRVKAMKEVQAR